MTVISRYPVIAHVDPSSLLDPSTLGAGLYGRMIDGRTVYQHVLFVEPRLLEQNAGSRQPARGAASHATVLAPPPLEMLTGLQRPELPLTDLALRATGALPDGPCRVGPRLREAGLDYLAQLALPPGEAEPVHQASVDDEMRAICRAALALLVLWVRAETKGAAAFDRPLPSAALTFLEDRADVFVASVLTECSARVDLGLAPDGLRDGLRARYVGPRAMAEVFGAGTDFPLCRELVAYWLPLWNRSSVIFNSPFDLMSELEVPSL